MTTNSPVWRALNPPKDLVEVLEKAPSVMVGRTVQELVDLSVGGPDGTYFEVAYEVPGKGRVVEATVARVRNGIAANYVDPAMRRRDPDCMVIADTAPTNKPTYQVRFGEDFSRVRQETLDWLATQPLCLFAFETGHSSLGEPALAVAPANAAFFALGLALLQGIIDPDKLPADFKPDAVIYTAPPFRHTHFGGKQVVVHNRQKDIYEMFSYNLYPGPSAKKGVYGMLIDQGEREGWVTAHCSAVRVVTPYDQEVVIMHEGASGGGKSEMLQPPQRMTDGRLLLSTNLVTGESRYLEMNRTCELHPVCDDMGLCHPAVQHRDGKLYLVDAEDAWFIRVDHINEYGKEPDLERLCACPPEPLLFMNIDAVPGSRAMIWEHIEDSPGKKCPNPRVILPRNIIPNITPQDEEVRVDIRSIGVRTPPCTREVPNYGIMGLLHVLPPALAWLWRLVMPRGHANPSIVSAEGLASEGVGSYWPFATGRQVPQANLLLDQIQRCPGVDYVLIPNQHIGAWKVGFMSEWITRDYLARRGNARFPKKQLVECRCPLLGYAPFQMRVEGVTVARWFLQVETQPEVGIEAYDAGAEILTSFFRKTVEPFLEPDLSPLGRSIIQCFLDGGSMADYEEFFPLSTK